MDLGQAALVIVLTLILVIAFNVAIYFSLRGERTTKQIELMRKVAQRVRRPWKDEDEQLKELSQKVRDLKDNDVDKTADE